MISAVVFAALVPILVVYLVKNAYKRPKNFPPGKKFYGVTVFFVMA